MNRKMCQKKWLLGAKLGKTDDENAICDKKKLCKIVENDIRDDLKKTQNAVSKFKKNYTSDLKKWMEIGGIPRLINHQVFCSCGGCRGRPCSQPWQPPAHLQKHKKNMQNNYIYMERCPTYNV